MMLNAFVKIKASTIGIICVSCCIYNNQKSSILLVRENVTGPAKIDHMNVNYTESDI